MTDATAGAGPDQQDESLTITTHPTITELIHTTAAANRGGLAANGFGAFSATNAIVLLLIGVPFSGGIPNWIVAALFLSGYFIAPFVWFVAWRRRDLVLASQAITLDRDGVEYVTASAQGRHAWSVYRRARDVRQAVVLEAAPDVGLIIPRSAIRPVDVEAFERILAAHGLRRPPTVTEALKPWIWLALGAAVAIAFAASQGVQFG